MSVVYLGHSQTKADSVEAFCAFMLEIVLPSVRASEGCISCQLLQQEDDPTRFTVVEVWASREAHRASVKDIVPEDIARYMALVEGPPSGQHYREMP